MASRARIVKKALQRQKKVSLATRDPMLPNPATPGTASAFNIEDFAPSLGRGSSAATTSTSAAVAATKSYGTVSGDIKNAGMFSVAGAVGRQMKNNLYDKFGDSWGVARQAGKHALRGAVVGGLAGGVSESAQGGSFWTGAKEGAWNGAVGWSGYRMLGHATGSQGLNPLSKTGAFRGAANMYDDFSKQAKAIIQNRTGANAAANLNGLNKGV